MSLAPATLKVEQPTIAEQTDRRATLMLADGTVFHARGLGRARAINGELIFTTAMTGYEEALTDPSYRGQILMFTYPLIGNYGFDQQRLESDRVQCEAVILSTLSSPRSGQGALASFLQENGVPVMHGADTRAIAAWIREHGAQPAALAVHDGLDLDRRWLQREVSNCAYGVNDYVGLTTLAGPIRYGSGEKTVALIDCGNKKSVIEELLARDLEVVALPSTVSAQDVMGLQPAGIIISNGPGNPAINEDIISAIRQLYGRVPMFGICLGHQLLALAAGASTYKLKFGHRGANHPVVDTETGRAFITTQNHGYAVDPATLPNELRVSHTNLNDGTVEGLRHRSLPIASVQFHPEGAPGPRDSGVVLDQWIAGL